MQEVMERQWLKDLRVNHHVTHWHQAHPSSPSVSPAASPTEPRPHVYSLSIISSHARTHSPGAAPPTHSVRVHCIPLTAPSVWPCWRYTYTHICSLQWSSLKYIMQRALSNIHSLMTPASRKKETHGSQMDLKALYLCLSQSLADFLFYLCACIGATTNNR